jgi:hypothetical protein
MAFQPVAHLYTDSAIPTPSVRSYNTSILELWVRIPLEAYVSNFSVPVLSCVGRDSTTGRSPIQGVLSNVHT